MNLIVETMGGQCGQCGFRYAEHNGHIIPCPRCAHREVKVLLDGACETIRRQTDLLRQAGNEVAMIRAQIDRLLALINTPQTADFFEAVKLEAAHQQERWGVDHDAGKAPPEWLWLLGHLASKATTYGVFAEVFITEPARTSARDKVLHHLISSAAVILNWHRHLTGEMTRFRPGIDAPKEK